MSRRLWTDCSLVVVITFALLYGNVRPIRGAKFNVVLHASSGSAPDMPNSGNPASGTAGVTATPTFSWKSAGATSYDLLLGTASPPSVYVSNITTFLYSASQLAAGTTYYWQVVARN